MNKTVTILIPLYNGIEYLDQCIASIQNQTYIFWKILIGVNGHGYHSAVYQEANKYTSPNITVKEYLTIGKPDTMNAMIEDVDTELICILDVDDWWTPEKLQKQMIIWDTGVWDVIGTQCIYVINEKLSESPTLPMGYVSDFKTCNPMINSSILMKRDDALWNNHFKGLDDYDLWLRLVQLGKKFFNLPHKCVYHRIRPNSAYNPTNNSGVKNLLQYYENNNFSNIV